MDGTYGSEKRVERNC
jgi:hypothetical protein